MKTISIIIPCHNEEHGIGSVLEAIPYQKLRELGYDAEVIVIDNNSSDKTYKVARQKGVTLVKEDLIGKGNALKTGFTTIDSQTDYVVIIDGDDTYKPQEIPRLIELLENDFCDVVTGSRMGGKTVRGSLQPSHRLANWFFAFLVRHFYLANITDALSGFFAMKAEVVKDLMRYLDCDGFAIEMEIITKLRRLGYSIYSVPITYDRRLGRSKLHSFKDGLKILRMFYRNLAWDPKGRTIPKKIAEFVTGLLF